MSAAVCRPDCQNGGMCASPGECNCTGNWIGPRCEDGGLYVFPCVFQCVPVCTSVYLCVHTRVYQFVPVCTSLYQCLLVFTYQCIPVVPVCSSVFHCVPVCTSLYQCLLVFMYQGVPVCTSVCLSNLCVSTCSRVHLQNSPVIISTSGMLRLICIPCILSKIWHLYILSAKVSRAIPSLPLMNFLFLSASGSIMSLLHPVCTQLV